jgi:hypothetical protein
MTYTLTAKRGFISDTVEIEEESSLAATIAAIAQILDLSCEGNTDRNRALWGKGRIELRNPHGVVIHVMEEK